MKLSQFTFEDFKRIVGFKVFLSFINFARCYNLLKRIYHKHMIYFYYKYIIKI